MLHPLTFVDTPTEQTFLCPGFVFQLPPHLAPEERQHLVDNVRDAAERVVRKWKLLAGTPVWDKARNVWVIDIPEDLESVTWPLVGFSRTSRDEPYHVAASLPSPLSPLSTSASAVLPAPTLSLFRPGPLPNSFSSYTHHRLPFLQVHATLLADALCVSITVPHGLLDAEGCGTILRGLTAEMHGRSDEWEAPPLFSGSNPFGDALDKLAEDKDVAMQAKQQGFTPVQPWDWAKMNPLRLIQAVVSVLWETWWWRAEKGYLFVSDAAVEALASQAKEEVLEQTGGDEYVSTHDVFVAWLLKAIFSEEHSPLDALSPSAVYTTRDMLWAYTSDPTFRSYTHTAAIPFSLLPAPLPLDTLSSTLVSALALAFRRQLLASRTLPSLQHFVRTAAGAMPFPQRNWPGPPNSFRPFLQLQHIHRWIVSSQTTMGNASLSVPSPSPGSSTDLPLLAFYHMCHQPLNFDSVTMIQRREGQDSGWFVDSVMRRSRWESLRREVTELERAAAAAQKDK
ncbi:hypothetical protein JCM10207_005570 [Rhodosporidiobolus poonsookiae]